MDSPVVYNVEKWIEENKAFFLPPVCNKMMHNEGQMKLFYVGGPNQRKDYHIEEGEELFYMVKGDMCLKVIEHGKHRDVVIKEGEVFLLPARIAHSPQRDADTVGLVIERERDENELDGLRYFVEENGVPTTNSLFEEWFHCEDLGVQLGPIIKKFFSSEQHKTGKPLPGTIPENPAIVLDSKRCLENPFSLHAWIERNRSEIDSQGSKSMFDEASHQFKVDVFGKGENTGHCERAETWIWQIEGQSEVNTNGKDYTLNCRDSMLIKKGQKYTSKREEGGIALICFQDPEKKKTLQAS